MNHYDSLIIGHITSDQNIDHFGNEVRQYGGAVLYASASAYALGHPVAALTKVAAADRARLDAFTIPQEDIICLPAAASTNMYNKYLTADKERRICKCFSRSDEITFAEIPADIDADVYHFAGLLYGDFSEETVIQTAQRGKVAVDVQGFLRHRNPDDQSMFFADWARKKEVLPYIDVLKTDAAEAEILTGLSDRSEAAKLLYAWGAKEIVITHNTEVLAYNGSTFYTCPIRARNLSGRTGRGDTTFAAYLNERLTHSIPDALLTATATVSLKMETPGVLRATRADIDAYIQTMYRNLL